MKHVIRWARSGGERCRTQPLQIARSVSSSPRPSRTCTSSEIFWERPPSWNCAEVAANWASLSPKSTSAGESLMRKSSWGVWCRLAWPRSTAAIRTSSAYWETDQHRPQSFHGFLQTRLLHSPPRTSILAWVYAPFWFARPKLESTPLSFPSHHSTKVRTSGYTTLSGGVLTESGISCRI
jgi:hypothetical protein